MILVFGKARSLRAPNLGCSRAEWVTWVIWHLAKIFCTRRDAWAGELSWWSCQSPVAYSCDLLSHLNSFHSGMFKLNTKFDSGLLLYLLGHFEYDGHTVHMLTQWCLPLQLISTLKSSLFMHVNSSPLSLAASLHQCRANHSRYINNGWTFSGQNIYSRDRNMKQIEH